MNANEKMPAAIEPVITGLVQVCVVVRDLEATMPFPLPKKEGRCFQRPF